jgi:hypothetical protein
LLLGPKDRAVADKFWKEEPFARNGGYSMWRKADVHLLA